LGIQVAAVEYKDYVNRYMLSIITHIPLHKKVATKFFSIATSLDKDVRYIYT